MPGRSLAAPAPASSRDHPTRNGEVAVVLLSSVLLELILLLMRPDAENDADAEHIQHQRRAAVADERQRDAGDRHDADHHADVLEHLEHIHAHDPDDDERALQVQALEGDDDHPVDEQEVQEQQHRRALEAELLADDDEDGVRVRIRNGAAIFGIALQEAVSRQAAAADGDLGVARLVSLVLVRVGRIDEGVDPLIPVLDAMLLRIVLDFGIEGSEQRHE